MTTTERHGTAIEWTHGDGFRGETWNPVVGCSKVSPGCAHCYAETLALRFGWTPHPWTPEHVSENVILRPERLEQPLRWRLPRMVFVNSMSDLFHEEIPYEYVREVFNVMRRCDGGIVAATGKRDPSHVFQVLTKRPERALDLWHSRKLGFADWPPNVWLGVSIENARYTWRADVLREIPAAVRFISAEPLLGSLLSVRRAEDGAPAPDSPLGPGEELVVRTRREGASPTGAAEPGRLVTPPRKPLDLTGIDWLIVGGESGGRFARPMHPDWARELRHACLAESDRPGTDYGRDRPAFFFKQWGSWAPTSSADPAMIGVPNDGKLLVNDPALSVEPMRYHGASPKSGGRELDGRTWDEMPAVVR